MHPAPGFRGAQLHEAVSGETRFQLVDIARWDTAQVWRDAAANPEMQAAARAAGADAVMRRAVQNTGPYRPALAFGDEG